MAIDWEKQFREAAQKRGMVLGGDPPQGGSPSQDRVVEGEVVDKAPTIENEAVDIDKGVDDLIRRYGGEFDVPLRGGGVLRVTTMPRPAPDACEVSHDEFKAITKAAFLFKGCVVKVMTKEEADRVYADKSQMVMVRDRIYVELNRDAVLQDSRPSAAPFNIVADPLPTAGPMQMDPRPWLTMTGGDITESRPIRLDKTVIGSAVKTANGWAFSTNVEVHRVQYLDGQVRPTIMLDDAVFKESLFPLQAVIIFRTQEYGEARTYLTTANHVKSCGGFGRSYGRPKILIPTVGGYVFGLDSKGQRLED